MPEQPQWSERTLDMPPQDPWADPPTAPHPARPQAYQPPPAPGRAVPAPGQAPPAPGHAVPADPSPFSRGRAQVNPRTQQFAAEHEPTGTGWPGAASPSARPGISWRWSELRRGSEWTTAATLFLFVCWGIWALSSSGSTTTAVIVFVVTLAVALGVFCLSRVVGHLVLERVMGRTRRSARGSHLVTALFLAGVGVGHLQQTQWVMDAFNWVRELTGN